MASNIEVKLDVLNQLASPALYAAALANRPAASFTGRLFVDSDSPSTGIYRDTGSTWVQVADQGAGTTGTLQQVTTNGSSTTIGISTSGNGIGIGTTIPASNRLDIHSGTGLQATLNGTGVTNAAIQLQLAGVGKWTLQNNYNAAANDFVITDVLNTLPRLTIKNTGQSFFGTVVTSSGLLVVNSATSDNHFVAIGANAPSLRLRDAGTGGVLNCGVGISTAVNNFIQGSASGNYCIFNGNTTASPILFGVYDAGTVNIQEAVRISAAKSLLISYTGTDTGEKLQVYGTSKFTNALTVENANINLSNNYILTARNFANTAYIGLITRNISDQISIDGGAYGTIFGGKVGIGTSTLTGILNVSGNGYSMFNSTGFGFLPAASGISLGWNRSGGNGEATLVWGSPASTYVFEICSYASSTITTRFGIDTTGIVKIVNTPVYATNALALAGGLIVGQIYKSATGVLSIVY